MDISTGNKQQVVNRSRLWRPALIALLLCVLALGVASPFVAAALNAQDPDIRWYLDDPSSKEYYLEDAGDLRGLATLVNGEAVDDSGKAIQAVSFEGVTIRLDNPVNLQNVAFEPIGTEDTPFAGTFDGASKNISGLMIEGCLNNVGLFGYCSKGSRLENIAVGSFPDAGVNVTADTEHLSNIGTVVGYSAGSITNCSSAINVTVKSTGLNASTDSDPIVVKAVGGVAGFVAGDVASCNFSGALEVGVASNIAVEETTDSDELDVAREIGGVVGRLGDPDNHGCITDCHNEGSVWAYTTGSGAEDRFGTTTYAKMRDVGGIVGYSNGSIYRCQNGTYNSLLRSSTGTVSTSSSTSIDGDPVNNRGASSTGGICGGLRSQSDDPNKYNDGDPDDPVEITDCSNQGKITGLNASGGICGMTGVFCTISRCYNGTVSDDGDNQIAGKLVSTRWNKPFSGGIVGQLRGGNVYYCANYAEVRNIQTGYYMAGIAGGLFVSDDHPEVTGEIYGCLNTGGIYTINESTAVEYREAGICGQNEGYVHDCIMLSGSVPYHSDQCIGANDWGLWSNLSAWSASDLTSANAAAYLNAMAAQTQMWDCYWYCAGSYPVLNSWVVPSESQKVTLSTAAIAKVEQLSPAPYVGNDALSVPTLRVTLTDGTVLVQNADFYVLPDTSAHEMSEGSPYKASIVGLGIYQGTVENCASYDISASNLEDAVVSVGNGKYSFGKVVYPTDVVASIMGGAVSADEYDYVIYSGNVSADAVKRGMSGCTMAFDSAGYVSFDAAGSNKVPVLEFGVEALNNESRSWWLWDRNGELIADSKGYVYCNTTTGGTYGSATLNGCFKFISGTPSGYVVKLTAKTDSMVLTGSAYGNYIIDQVNLYKECSVTSVLVNGDTWYWDASRQAFYTLDKDGNPQSGVPHATFTGKQIEPEFTIMYGDYQLVKGTDYYVVLGDPDPSDLDAQTTSNNRDITDFSSENYVRAAATVRPVDTNCLSNYFIGYFGISPANLADCEISLDSDQWAYRAGEQITPTVHVKLNGVELIEGTDYTVSYENNTDKGKATYTVTALANLQGGSQTTYQGTFDIVEGTDISSLRLADIPDTSFNFGAAVRPQLSFLNDKGESVSLVEGKDYEFSCSTTDVTKCVVEQADGKTYNEVGTPCTVEVTGIGMYTGTLTGTFHIVPYDATANATGQLVARTQNMTLDDWVWSKSAPYNMGLTNPVVNVLAYPIVDWAAYEKGDYDACYGEAVTLTETNSTLYGGTINRYPVEYYQKDKLVSPTGETYTNAAGKTLTPAVAVEGELSAKIYMRVSMTSGKPRNGVSGVLTVEGLSLSYNIENPGDVNNNGSLDILDAQITYDLSRGVYTDEAWADLLACWGEGATKAKVELVADVNNDGTVDSADARAIQYAIHHNGVFGES